MGKMIVEKSTEEYFELEGEAIRVKGLDYTPRFCQWIDLPSIYGNP